MLSRVTVLGVGAIGGPVALALHDAGLDVRGLARGPHLRAIAADGLRVRAPWGDATLGLEVASSPADFDWRDDDVVVLATKSQDTRAALAALAEKAPRRTAVVCAQNGLANERVAQEFFDRVYGAMVYTPGAHLDPGVVATYGIDRRGLIDLGPVSGDLDLAESLAAALRVGRFVSEANADVMDLKRAKLLFNLGNVVQALVGPDVPRDEVRPVLDAAQAELVACYQAEGRATEPLRARFLSRVGFAPEPGTIDGQQRTGGSSWQSLARGAGTIETAWLNGEVVAMGKQYGVATPVNARLVALGEAAAEAFTAGGMSAQALTHAVLATG